MKVPAPLAGIWSAAADRVHLNFGFFKNLAQLSGGTAFAQGLAVLAAPVLTRIYAPADFGAIAVFGSILGMIVVVAALRFELAIPLPANPRTAAYLLALALASVLAWTGLTAVGVGFGGGMIVRLTQTPALGPYLWLLPIGVLGGSLYKTFSYWAIRRGAYGRIASTQIAQSTAQVGSQVGIGLAVAGPAGLILGQVIGQSVGVSSLGSRAWADARDTLRRLRWSRLKAVAARYRRFPLISSFSAVLNSGGLLLPSLLLAALFGPEVAGLFALVKRVMETPMRLVGGAAAQAFMGHASRVRREEQRDLAGFGRDVGLSLLVLGAVPFGVLIAAGPALFAFVFGDAWTSAGLYARILAIPLLIQFAVSPLSQTLHVLERQGLHLAWNVVRLLLILGAFSVAALLDTGAATAIGAYGVAIAAAYLLLLAAVRGVIRKGAHD